MGLRQRTSRINRRRQKERERARRRAQMMLARPGCPECEAILSHEASLEDIWSCDVCGSTFLRSGRELLPQIDAGILLLTEEEPQRKAA